jgi:hypothetical protein
MSVGDGTSAFVVAKRIMEKVMGYFIVDEVNDGWASY